MSGQGYSGLFDPYSRGTITDSRRVVEKYVRNTPGVGGSARHFAGLQRVTHTVNASLFHTACAE